jgi:hypothetical protein
VAFANYGLTDNFDVGLAVPLVKVKMDAVMHTTIVNVATQQNVTLFHQFDPNKPTGCVGNHITNNNQENDLCESGDASGIGDIVVRGKLGLIKGEDTALAAGIDARLPTGRERTCWARALIQIKPYLIAGFMSKSKFSPTSTRATPSPARPTCSASCPTSSTGRWGSTPRRPRAFTIMADVIGRTLIDAHACACATRSSTTATGDPSPRSGRRMCGPSSSRRRRT